jgi:RHS repeat-associated protein
LVDSALYATGDTLSNVVVTSSASGAAKVQWLVPDHLGTPRIILDQTGNLANVKRHDYLPFGEELFAGTGGRTILQGYSGGDGVRQQFTSKERDVETGLDYFLARYSSRVQGRFTSVDPALDSAKSVMPQSWNRYTYCLNNPLMYIDPTGKRWAMQYHEDDKKWYYAWFATDKEYDSALASGQFQAVAFDESKSYDFIYEEQSEIDHGVRLNPDGTHSTFDRPHPGGPRGVDMMQNQAF